MSCPVCNGCCAMSAIKGVTDLWTLRPDIAKLLETPEDGYKYTVHSSKKANLICLLLLSKEIANDTKAFQEILKKEKAENHK